MKKYVLVMIVAGLLIFGGCAAKKPPPPFPLMKIPPSEYPGFSDDMAYDGLSHSISQSLEYLRRVPPEKTFQFGGESFDAAHMIRSLENFLRFIETNPSGQELTKFIRSNYLVYKSVGSDEEGRMLFTGYYEPLLYGSLYKSNKYNFPVYGRPQDLMTIDLSLFSSDFEGRTITGRLADQTFLPYPERKEIEEQGVLEGKAEAIAWVSERVDLFFLQIQGSGKIRLDNGDIINVHYNSQNGRPYRSIGKLLIDQGKIPKKEMSMQRIREYLRNHPDEVQDILNYNPSYVFFSLEDGGPFGALNVTLTPGRSLALDRKIFPLSGLSFIETHKPLLDGSGKISKWVNFSRFVLNQDTGGAIRGPGRADLFWGNGDYAEIAAGYMQHRGSLYLLVLKP
jgi:membrane-bound lytic murein transglycosylase A